MNRFGKAEGRGIAIWPRSDNMVGKLEIGEFRDGKVEGQFISID